VFKKRLTELRKKSGLSQYELAEKLGFSRGKYSNYEQGTRQPDYETLQKIADYFNVTTDYLLGRSDKPNYTAEQEDNENYDSIQEINRLLKEYGIDQSGFFDIEKWKAMGPEEIKQLESYFKFITEEAKKKNQQD